MARKVPTVSTNGSTETLNERDIQRKITVALRKASVSGSSMIVFLKKSIKGEVKSVKLNTTSDLNIARPEIRRHILAGCTP